jgi:SPP1 gp7 family putative phage head morphogenesis protein
MLITSERGRRLLSIAVLRALGGPGSGNFGHAGRPGEVGGSGDTSESFGTDRDISEKYPKAPDVEARTETQVNSIRKQLARQGRLNSDGTVSLYHVTYTDNVSSITNKGLVPAFEKAAYQPEFVAKHSEYATYFWTSEKEAKDWTKENGGKVIEARIPITKETVRRIIPDEDWSDNINRGPETLIKGGLVAFIGGVPSVALRTLAALIPLHRAADSMLPRFRVALRASFKVAAREFPNERKVVVALEHALKQTMPRLLLDTFDEGGDATKIPSQRTLGGPGSGNFGHSGRPGEVGGSSDEGVPRIEDSTFKKGDKVLYRGKLAIFISRTIKHREIEQDGKRIFVAAFRVKPANSITALAGKLKFRFTRKSDAAESWAEEHAAELIKDITETTRDSIRFVVARLLDADTDLTSKEALAEISKAVGDEDRAELIARTETMRAVHAGQREAWSQATEAGLLTGDERPTWITTPDDKLCPICEELDGEIADEDGFYGDGQGPPPAHPRCRCTEGLTY